ncbi:hypothetical protein [Allomuricauda sp. NBRC 101325]|uniref:hypothetical protein n=1 Tax=Allomuricauda sp. NBRC 101325 TaxID=1113758 RepID=UPI0024A213D7|nr:hypothetical protein [Muricauda sp. NBRC 101325]GLU43887.1 hypothetical protein Musp01_15110 [Muricauda sp. NBRC 101325]
MKKLVSNILRLVLVVLVLSFSSCQEEFEDIGGDQETIDASSSTAALIMQTSSNDGSYDNIVDGASCFAIQFPYVVSVNGVEISIDSESDLEVIEAIFDELQDDEDVLDILFPITIILSDYSEINIESQAVLEELAFECLEGGLDDDIECIDFVYPITMFTFDVNNQQTGEVTIESDFGMRRFFAEMGSDDLVSIQFPLTLKKYDGTEIVVNNNHELADTLEYARELCDEDDDNDYSDDDFTKEEVDALLVACPFEIRQVVRNEVDNTDQYFERLMVFNEDGTVDYYGNLNVAANGTWSTSQTDNGVLLSLHFDTLFDFTLEWYVYKLEEGVIKFYKDNGNRIVLRKNCEVDPNPEANREALISLLQECEWIVKKVKNQGEEVERLLGYEFQFKPDGNVVLGNGVSVTEGTWEIGLNSQLQLSLLITMGVEPDVSFEWPLVDLLDSRLKFKIEETDHEMILLKVCDDSAGDGDVSEIRNILMGGAWNVALYQEGELDSTASFTGMDFNFQAEHQLQVSVNADPTVNGLWRVLRDSEEGLKLYINFDTMDELAELTEDWKFVSMTSTRIELMDESSDGTIKTLVFEKP